MEFLLSIGGYDPSGGAGVLADIETFRALDKYGLSAITEVTAQYPGRFFSSFSLPHEIFSSILNSVLSFPIDGIKLGMIRDELQIDFIINRLKTFYNVVVYDPVLFTTAQGYRVGNISLIKKLLNHVDIITPNVDELIMLTGGRISKREDVFELATLLLNGRLKAIVVKGFKEGDFVYDFLVEKNNISTFKHRYLLKEVHGTGCHFASALLVNITNGLTLENAIPKAIDLTKKYIFNSFKLGEGFTGRI